MYNFIVRCRELFSNPKTCCRLCFRKLVVRHRFRKPSKSFPEICHECSLDEGARIRYNNRHKRNRRKPTGKLTVQGWLEALKLHAWACVSCGRHGRHQLSIDHIEALTDGGTNTIDNIQPLCLKCHAKKDGHSKKFFSKFKRRYREFRIYIWHNFKVGLPKWDKS